MTEFHPKVSIVIPVFNGENYLSEAIESALAQTYDNCEIIVVNDGSTDRTEEIALSYEDKIRYFSKSNGGQSSALNMGIEDMEGEYFSWLSHDDKYYSNKLSEQITVLSKLENKNTIIYSASTIINNKGKIIKSDFIERDGTIHPSWYLLRYNAYNGNTLLINREIFRKYGKFNINRPHTSDVELFFQLSRYLPFHYIKDELVYSRSHSEQATNRRLKYHIYESNLFLLESLNKLSDNELLNISGFHNTKLALIDLSLNWSKRGYKYAYLLAIARLKFTTSISWFDLAKIKFNCKILFFKKTSWIYIRKIARVITHLK